MKSLKNCIKLSHSIKIYVPSTKNINELIDNTHWVNKTLEFLSKTFGGATSSKALGAWLSNDGNLVKENVTIVFSYSTQIDLEKNIDLVYNFCLAMKNELNQEAIALEVNNELYFI